MLKKSVSVTRLLINKSVIKLLLALAMTSSMLTFLPNNVMGAITLVVWGGKCRTWSLDGLALCSFYALCVFHSDPQADVFVAAHSWLTCPNNAPTVYNQAQSDGVVGGGGASASAKGTTFPYGELRGVASAFSNCNGTSGGVKQVFDSACTPTVTFPDNPEDCDSSGYYWNSSGNTCSSTPTNQTDCSSAGAYWNFASNSCSPMPTNSGDCDSIGGYWNSGSGTCSGTPNPSQCEAEGGHWDSANNMCVPASSATPTPTPTPPPQHCTINWALAAWCDDYDFDECYCPSGTNKSPVLVDVLGNGFRLTDAPRGVNFDLDTDGTAERIAWTAPNSDDAFLALDHDGNGRIEHGTELFGNYTRQPPSDHPNGFLALAQFDRPHLGGNGDGVIDGRDSIFASLRLWQDVNHNGVSEPGELHTLPELGVSSVSLGCKDVKRRDRYGNLFRYQSPVTGTDNRITRRLAYDVFLVPGR